MIFMHRCAAVMLTIVPPLATNSPLLCSCTSGHFVRSKCKMNGHMCALVGKGPMSDRYLLLPDPSRAHWPRILEDIHNWHYRFVDNEIAKVATRFHARVCEHSHSRVLMLSLASKPTTTRMSSCL